MKIEEQMFNKIKSTAERLKVINKELVVNFKFEKSDLLYLTIEQDGKFVCSDKVESMEDLVFQLGELCTDYLNRLRKEKEDKGDASYPEFLYKPGF